MSETVPSKTLMLAPALRALLCQKFGLAFVAVDDSESGLAAAGKAESAAGLLVSAAASKDDAGAAACVLAGELDAAVGGMPKLVAMPGAGIFAVGASGAECQARLEAFRNDSELPDAPQAYAGRMAGKIALVTGAAQGFGLGIAEQLAGEGATVLLGDINFEGAREAARAIDERYGVGRAMAVSANITDPESLEQAALGIARRYGALDLIVANAGVLRAESVKTQPEKDFDFTTSVNYRGYFLTVKYFCPLLAGQHAANPDWRGDIVQINSKSGLQGSNKNFAYAASKFGTIGMTQSFAMELIADGIKVNSICPGNFFDGPLWSDPEKGLFVQYLGTGKVPGAKTIEDVKKFYESKVPMGRGCTPEDVMHAVYYLVDQQYETGQALPVTGGQVMLK